MTTSTTTNPTKLVNEFMENIKEKTQGQPNFHQAVEEVAEYVLPFEEENPKYKKYRIFERICAPDRIIIFRVCWEDDNREIRVNRGYRVQFSNAIGPYKGGLRFHPTVCLDVLKFLGFEQIFKNSLTTLPIGGGKGGSDFDPKGKTDDEVMRFCQSFMTELYRHIGPDTDVPAGDIGVGAREIGYLFGQYKRIKNKFTGVLTGKAREFGGSLIRPEATGYGCVYFLDEMLKARGDSIEGKVATVSGSGNVAQYATEKMIHLGGKVVTLSDSGGFIYDPDGITQEKLEWVKNLKEVRRGRISEYAKEFNCEYYEGKRPWGIKCDIALPCATQNEVNEEEAKTLVKNSCIAVSEGANMPSDPGAIAVYQDAKLAYGLGKAANAGGVAVSALEMTQNSMRLSWTKEELDQKLQGIMKSIHSQCVQYGTEGNHINYVKGANIGGYVKVANAMLDYGVS